MPDVLEEAARIAREMFGTGERAIISEAPGGGPEVNREGKRFALGQSGHIRRGEIGSVIPRGSDATGFGGHGDAIFVEENDAQIQDEIQEHLLLSRNARHREPRPSMRQRYSEWFSIEGHTKQNAQYVAGPFSMFDGTVTAPGAGASVQTVPISLPATTPSPVLLLNRYPGALYLSLYIRSFSFMPTAGTMTGIQECWFTDAGGAVVGLGIFNPANVSAATFQTINALCSSPLTDPGNAQIGTIFINNIGIGGTPVTTRYQVCIGYMAFVPDPAFNEQVVVPPTPAEIMEGLRSMGATGG